MGAPLTQKVQRKNRGSRLRARVCVLHVEAVISSPSTSSTPSVRADSTILERYLVHTIMYTKAGEEGGRVLAVASKEKDTSAVT